jgi:hypothetical protein
MWQQKKKGKQMATKPLQVSPSENPKQTFESSLALMQGGRGSAARRKAPIVARTLPIAGFRNERETEERALTDAARALAQLWKVSPHLVR